MALSRRQLFEFNDLAQAPAAVRDTIVESLSRTLAWGRILDELVPAFERFLEAAGTREVLDLGSGAGGPASIIVRAYLRAGRTPPRFLLTDLHPRPELWARLARDPAHAGAIDFVDAPVDATRVPEALAAGRARAVINVLHHFPPPVVAALLADAARSSRGIFVAECFDRDPAGFLSMTVPGLPALLANPVLSERDRWAKVVLTWLTPAAVLISLWDGLVSTLRIHTPAELAALAAPLEDRLRFQSGEFRFAFGGRGIWFSGLPRA
jgi:hypothetical protein